jgi:hypothetical protein
MPEKGSWKGECFTPECTRTARFIAVAEGPRVKIPQERYRCAQCCDLVDAAAPQRGDNVYPGQPGWDEWRAELDAIFAMPLAALEAAAAGTRGAGEHDWLHQSTDSRTCKLCGLFVARQNEAKRVYLLWSRKGEQPGEAETDAQLPACPGRPAPSSTSLPSLPSAPRPPFNGYPLLASAPRKDGNGHFIVVEYGSETVVADARALTDSEWDNGHYCKDRETAMRDFVSRLVKEYGTEPPR